MNPYQIKCWCIVDSSGNVIDRIEEEDDEGKKRPAIFQEKEWALRQLPFYPGSTLVECEAVIQVPPTPEPSLSHLDYPDDLA